uniref:Uncharacterized protein n=1 Tax=Timema douglasi TaxID=61478 RepID=A0A7R8Z910_TIMDO|nr:unnamed protein product [Timema douglasi]
MAQIETGEIPNLMAHFQRRSGVIGVITLGSPHKPPGRKTYFKRGGFCSHGSATIVSIWSQITKMISTHPFEALVVDIKENYKYSFKTLQELCQVWRWGQPSYQYRIRDSPNKIPLYECWIVIPNLPSSQKKFYIPVQTSSVEDAIAKAANHINFINGKVCQFTIANMDAEQADVSVPVKIVDVMEQPELVELRLIETHDAKTDHLSEKGVLCVVDHAPSGTTETPVQELNSELSIHLNGYENALLGRAGLLGKREHCDGVQRSNVPKLRKMSLSGGYLRREWQADHEANTEEGPVATRLQQVRQLLLLQDELLLHFPHFVLLLEGHVSPQDQLRTANKTFKYHTVSSCGDELHPSREEFCSKDRGAVTFQIYQSKDRHCPPLLVTISSIESSVTVN